VRWNFGVVCLSAAVALGAQVNGVPVQVAGWNRYDPANLADGLPALRTVLFNIYGLAIGPDGLMVVNAGSRIRKIQSDGTIHTLATDSNIDPYAKLAFDHAGNLYYTATLGVIKLTPAGTSTRVVGIGQAATQEGAAATSIAPYIEGMTIDPSGNVVFSDGLTMRVWRVDGTGVLRAVAGMVTPGTGGEGGPAVQAQLEFPGAVTYDSAGALYISDTHRILKVGTDGTLTRVATAPAGGAFQGPLALDATGAIYYAPTQYTIAKLNADGSNTPIAGNVAGLFSNGCGSGADPTTGQAKTASFGVIGALLFDAAGNLLVTDQSNSSLRQINPAGQIRTLAGAPPSFSGDGGPATAAVFSNPQGLAFDAVGNMYVADTGNHRIRKIATDGTISTVGGQGGPTADMVYSCSGSSFNFLHSPAAVAVDAAGTLYVADTLNHRVVKLAAGGTPVLFAGTGTQGFAASPVGTAANTIPLDTPTAVGVDHDGNIWVGDHARRTLKINAAGTVVDVLPGMRTRTFNSDAGGFYLTSELISYQVMAGDQLVPLTGSAISSVDPSGPAPVEIPDLPTEILSPAGITRDGQGAIYALSFGFEVISPACNSTQMASPGQFPWEVWALAESPAGDVYGTDAQGYAVWRMPHLKTVANELPTPQFWAGAIVQNAASQLIGTFDTFEQTGGFTSSPVRLVISDKVAPGEIVRINGQCIGPINGVLAQFDASGRLPASLGGVSATIGGLPMPLIAVQSESIVAVTPFGLPANQAVQLTVTFNGVTISTQNVGVVSGVQTVAYRPGVVRFVEQDGSYVAAAINQDGTINSQAHPAPAGSVVELWATGMGQTNPAGVDGQAQTNTSAKYLSDTQVTLGGTAAVVQYAGPAPGFAGLSQINVQVPPVKSGAEVLQVLIGGAPFLQVVHLWVQ
jgi:uncharacterized protein (TIGR03437 family)